MIFYELTHPEYATDMEFSRHNPVRVRSSGSWLPCVYCPACAGRRGSFGRLRVSIPDSESVRELLSGKVVALREWPAVAADLGKILQVPAERLAPGLSVGLPQGEILRATVNDINHPFPGVKWVTPRVVELLRQAQVTGIEYHRVNLIGSSGISGMR